MAIRDVSNVLLLEQGGESTGVCFITPPYTVHILSTLEKMRHENGDGIDNSLKSTDLEDKGIKE